MSHTIVDATSTTPDAPSSEGEFSIFQRVYGIPLVAAALDKLHETLSTNALTAKPYAFVVQGISVVAYQCWQPVQRRLAPLIARVDDFANATFDLAETRFPYLFYATPQDIMDAAYNTRINFFDDARATLDEGIKRPAVHVAEGIDERLAPLFDYYKDHIEPQGRKCARSARANNIELHETQYQYQRALDLAKALIERIASLPCDQWQQTSFLLQRFVIQVQELSDAMLAQLHTLQQTISYLATSMQRSVAAAQKQLTITLVEAANALSATLADLQNALTSEELTAGERIDWIASITTSRINPLLERVRTGVNVAMQGKTSRTPTANTTPGRIARTSSDRSDKPSPSRSAKTAPDSISRTTSARTTKRATGLKKRSST